MERKGEENNESFECLEGKLDWKVQAAGKRQIYGSKQNKQDSKGLGMIYWFYIHRISSINVRNNLLMKSLPSTQIHSELQSPKTEPQFYD